MTILESLFADRQLTLAERAAHDEDPRPGIWAGEAAADLRKLSQNETDILVTSSMWRTIALSSSIFMLDEERAMLEAAIGRHAMMSLPRLTAHLKPQQYIKATTQRGGIHSDPLVRLLAFRAWGDRDQKWFERRGVRRGNMLTDLGWPKHEYKERILVCRQPSFANSGVVTAYDGEYLLRDRAENDANPGEFVYVKTYGQLRVGERLRHEDGGP